MFTITHKDKKSLARTGILKTPHGSIETPVFIPVATQATVKALDSKDLELLGASVLLANTYHLHLRPGEKLVKSMGGLHGFMHWNKPIFTDSGGFQAFSLGYGMEHNIGKIASMFPVPHSIGMPGRKKLAVVTEQGVEFKSHLTGEKIVLTPKISMKIQRDLGADIILAFDECTSPLSDYAYTKKALVRTHRWAKESLAAYKNTRQQLFGIIQGGEYKDLRLKSASFIASLSFDGFAVGGSLGKSKKDMHKILEWVIPVLNQKNTEKPRHLLGIGGVDDLFECVERGIDSFDCVAPARIARRGNLYVHPPAGTMKNKFVINIENAKYKADKNPIDDQCTCPTCRSYSRAYLRHLFVAQELSYYRLATLHNLHFILRLMEEIRASIRNCTFARLKKTWISNHT